MSLIVVVGKESLRGTNIAISLKPHDKWIWAGSIGFGPFTPPNKPSSVLGREMVGRLGEFVLKPAVAMKAHFNENFVEKRIKNKNSWIH